MKNKSTADLNRKDKLCRRIIEYGILALIILSPLPIASVEEWSVYAIQMIVAFMMTAYFFLSVKPKENPIFSRLFKWPKIFFIALFAWIGFQLIPLPRWLVEVISPASLHYYDQFASGSGNLAFVPISLAPFQTFREGLELLTYFLLGFLIIKTVVSRLQMRRIFMVLVGMGFFEAFYGIFELYRQNPRLLFYKKTINLDMVTGTFVNQNHLAGYLCMIIPLVIGIMVARIDTYSLPDMNWRQKLVHFAERGLSANLIMFIFLLVMSVAVLLSRSRMGLFLVVFAILVFLELTILFVGTLRRSRSAIKRFLQVVFLIIAVVFMYVGVDATLERFSLEKISGETRTQYWGNTLDIFKDFPLFGCGLGTFVSVYPAYEEGEIHGPLIHAHNDYLEYAAELGLVGFFFLLGGMIILFVKTFHVWKQRRNPEVKGLGLGGIVSIFVIAVFSITDFNLHIPANMILFTIVLSLTSRVVYYRFHKNHLPRSPEKKP
jgi:O-antigen ligase